MAKTLTRAAELRMQNAARRIADELEAEAAECSDACLDEALLEVFTGWHLLHGAADAALAEKVRQYLGL